MNKVDQVLVKQLRRDFPDLNFRKSRIASWSPGDKIVFYTDDFANLFHELGHATLAHDDFAQDIELLKLERDAWQSAKDLAKRYGYTVDDEAIESALDSYRDWLHARSLCPKCGQTGVQNRENLEYACVNCGARWIANDARRCGLKRRIVKKTPPDVMGVFFGNR